MKKKNVKGFTLLGTMFILIILAMVGIYLIRIGIMQQQEINYTLLTTRAEHAAQSALLLAQEKWLQDPTVCSPQTFHFDKQAKALAGYNVNVTCQHTILYPQMHPNFYAIELQAVASKGNFGDREYVSYQMNRRIVLENP